MRAGGGSPARSGTAHRMALRRHLDKARRCGLNAYRGLDLDQVMARMRGRVFCDLRNVYEPEHMSARGFAYAGVGR